MQKQLHSLANPQKAETTKRFFKTGIGEYAEGDIFIGVTVPEIRGIAKRLYKEANFEGIAQILHSKIHEERALALMILVEKYQKTKDESVIEFYLEPKNLQYVNNWDLVDLSCYKILGEYLLQNPHKIDILYEFTTSQNLWIRRIAIVSTFAFIRKNSFEHTIKISEILMNDKHDLIHKAVGWMLREVGKRDEGVLTQFLQQYHQKMPRICYRYANERLRMEF